MDNSSPHNNDKNRTKISLSEKKRWAEYRNEKELEETTEQLTGQDAESRKKARLNDPVLTEAVNIAADYSDVRGYIK